MGEEGGGVAAAWLAYLWASSSSSFCVSQSAAIKLNVFAGKGLPGSQVRWLCKQYEPSQPDLSYMKQSRIKLDEYHLVGRTGEAVASAGQVSLYHQHPN